MKHTALKTIKEVSDPSNKLNLLREYVQAMVLRSLHESEAFVNLSFVGGTALRFVHDLPRFSEDLDFSLHKREGYDPEAWMKKIRTALVFQGFNATIAWNNKTTIHKAWIKVSEILKEAGLAVMREQNLSIELEIDTEPPGGAVSEKGIVNRHALLSLNYYDLPSLMAGKLHALLTRKYVKGRDWYDLLWYRSKRPPVEPNLEQLQNALDQTEGEGVCVAGQWKRILSDKLGLMDFSAMVDDVQNFLERREDGALLTRENLLSVLK